MSDRTEAPASRSDEGARIQTFLIADVRGWTLFTQTRGDEVAAKLAARFAENAREVVEHRGGRVLELRGDEAMCVFASARQAIRAAVELQDRFYEETVADPELPLPVGIGLDAGEAVPVEGGYRGGALNLAARLCGQAKAGEILASRSVTHLAQRVDGIRYVDRGRVKLKNLSEPVEVVGVVPEGIDPAERLRATLPPMGPASRRSRWRVPVAAAVAVALLAGVAIVVLPGGDAPTIPAGSVGLLDPSGDLEGTVGVGGLPRGLVEGAGSIWAVDHEDGELDQIDPSTFEVAGPPIPVGIGPTGVAFAGGLLWVTNTDDRTVSVVDPQARRVVQTVVVGNGPTGIVADGDRVWVANSVDATVSEIDVADGNVLERYPVGEEPVALAVGDGAVWVANAYDDTVSRIVPGEGATAPIPVGRGPAALAFGFGSLWVANAEAGSVTKVDPATMAMTLTVPVGGGPGALAVRDDAVWVASEQAGTIRRIDPVTTQVTQVIDVGNEPRALAASEAGIWIGVEASPAEHQGGTLRIVTELPVHIDPHSTYSNIQAAWVLASTYDGLVTYRRSGGPRGTTVVPDLAVALPVPTDGGRTFSFRLRDGIHFSDGHLLAPRDVVASFERALINEGSAGYLLSDLVGAESCVPAEPDACDLSAGIEADEAANTVTFHLRRPSPDLLRILATSSFAIVPEGTPLDLGGDPVPATGPYVVDQIGEDGSVVLTRNPTFEEWSADAQPEGFADRIVVTAGISPQDQIAMVERGEADLGLDGVPVDLIDDLERRASDQLMRSQFPAMGSVALNTATAPFENLDARRAVAFALDRAAANHAWSETAAILDLEGGIYGEDRLPNCQILPPNTVGYAPYCPYNRSEPEVVGRWEGQDLAHALELVRRSGTEGATVTLAMTPCLDATAEVVTATLRDLGYEVVRETDGPLRPDEADCWFGALSADADVSYTAWAYDYPSPASFLVPLLSCVRPDGTPAVQGAGNLSFNAANFCDPEIDRRMQRALDLQLTDPHASARAFESLEHDLVDLAPLVPFQTANDLWLVSTRARNVEFSTPNIGPIVSQVWVR